VFTLKPCFDVHIGNIACDERAFKEYLADSDEATYFIGGGDLMDAVIVSDAKRYRKGVDASGEAEDIIDYQVERTAAILSPYRERFLGLGSGNHEDTLVTRCSTDMTRRLCRKLDVPYLGYSGLYRLMFSQNGNRGRTIDIRYHHGWAAGRTPGGQLTSNTKDVMHWDADIFLYGHGHKLLTDSVSRLSIRGENKLISKDLIVCLCGTWLKTYVLGETTYSEKKGFSPIRIGSPYITIRPTYDGVRLKAHTS
jgi:hypothetical protein